MLGIRLYIFNVSVDWWISLNIINIHKYIKIDNRNIVFVWIRVYLSTLYYAVLFSKYCAFSAQFCSLIILLSWIVSASQLTSMVQPQTQSSRSQRINFSIVFASSYSINSSTNLILLMNRKNVLAWNSSLSYQYIY